MPEEGSSQKEVVDAEQQTGPSAAARLTAFSLNRPVTVLVLFVSLLVVGVIATLGIPLELFPRGYVAQFLYVFVPWQNAPTQEIMEKITLPLEEELSTVRGLDGLNSYTQVGRAGVFLRFKQGTDMDVAYREVRDRVERAKALFPDDADRVFIRKDNPSDMPVAFIGLILDPDLTDYYDVVEKEIVLPLSRIDGVAHVEKNGIVEKEIIIEVDKDKADAHGLNLYQVARDLRGDNFTMASGNVRDGGKKFILRSVASFKSLEEVENRMIMPSVRLKDVAAVKYEEPDRRFSVRVNGRPALALGVMKAGEANTVRVCRQIAKTVELLSKNPRLAGIDMEIFFNQGKMVESSIGNLVGSGRVGGLLAGLVLFIFLRRFRLTAIITFSIPLCILIALIVMFFVGETLNILTILALVICVGLLVDNSVVVAENIHRHYKDGLSRRDACISGASEIALAITMATLTTVIVFLPVALVEGEGQFFLMRLALPISVSLLASLAVALVFIPLCVYLTLPSRADASGPPSRVQQLHLEFNRILRALYESVFGRINRGYVKALAFFLNRRTDLVLILAVMFALSQLIAYRNIKLVETQEEDRSSFNIGIEMSNEFDFDRTRDYFREAEKVVSSMKDQLGLKGFLIVHFRNGGRIEGWMDEKRRDKPLAKKSAKMLADALPEKPGVKLYYDREDRVEEGKENDLFRVRLEGDDATLLQSISDDLEPRFLGIDGVIGAQMSEESAPNEMALVMNRDRMTKSQVNPEVVAGLIGYALRGQQLTKFHRAGREVPVRVWYEEQDRNSLDNLGNFAVPTGSGAFIPLASLTDVQMLKTPRGIFRQDKKITQTLTLQLDPDRAKETRERLIAAEQAIDLPEGVAFNVDSFSNRNEELENLKFAGLLSVIFIYLLMGFLFESFILPLSIILTIPLAGIGVVWIHWITGKDVDFLGIVGVILLIGVVVNNGIVLIDYVNRLRADGMERTAALLHAAERRFRPIVMTALTTIIGMVPLAISPPSDIGLSYKSFGLTLIGGMTTATILTLLVVPVFYTLFDDSRTAVGRTLAQALKAPKTTAQFESRPIPD